MDSFPASSSVTTCGDHSKEFTFVSTAEQVYSTLSLSHDQLQPRAALLSDIWQTCLSQTSLVQQGNLSVPEFQKPDIRNDFSPQALSGCLFSRFAAFPRTSCVGFNKAKALSSTGHKCTVKLS